MLQFFRLPFLVEPGRDFRIAVEKRAEIAGVQIGAAFDKRRRAQQQQQIFVGDRLLPINAGEVDVLDPPGHDMVQLCVHRVLLRKLYRLAEHARNRPLSAGPVRRV